MQSENPSVTIGNLKLELRQGNIALIDADAIVNAANEYLNLGLGVAGAIREIGGDSIQNECNEIGFCPVGSAVITGAGNLKAKYVIHAVGPMFGEGNEKEKLQSAVSSAIKLAEEKGISSMAFPAISAGYFHFPLEDSVSSIVSTIRSSAPTLKSVNHIILCLSTDRNINAVKDMFLP